MKLILTIDEQTTVSDTIEKLTSPILFEKLFKQLNWKYSKRDLINYLYSLSKKGSCLFFNNMIFPKTLFTIVECEIIQDFTGRFLSRLSDGTQYRIPIKATKNILHMDKAHVALLQPKDPLGAVKAIPILITERQNFEVFGRVQAGVPMTIKLERRQESYDFKFTSDFEVKPGSIVRCQVSEKRFLGKETTLRVLEVLGHENDQGIESLLVYKMWNFPQPYQSYEKILSLSEKERTDFTLLPFVTIDGPSTRDFDDAIFCEDTGKGWKLYVAISDVAAFINPGSEEDIEARKRLLTIYLPHATNPMFPREISNELCSLIESKTRPTLCSIKGFDYQGNIESVEFIRANINTYKRLTYGEVNDFFENNLVFDPLVSNNLINLRALTDEIIKKNEYKKLNITQENFQLVLDGQGQIERIIPEERGLSQRIVEECMLAYNIEAARFLTRNYDFAIFRNHHKPEDLKVQALYESLALRGIDVNRDLELREFITEVLFDYDQDILYSDIRSDILTSFNPAVYEIINSGHFSIGEDAYTQASSPIRRYPDYLVQCLIENVLDGNENHIFESKELLALCIACSARLKEEIGAENEAKRLLVVNYMKRFVGHKLHASVRSTGEKGIFVLLENNVEAYIPSAKLKDKGWIFDTTWVDHKGNQVKFDHQVCLQIDHPDVYSRRINVEVVNEDI